MESVTSANDNMDLQRRKIEIEERKIEIECDKIKIEKLRAWTGSASTFGSLLVVAATVALGIWSQYEQAKLQHDIQERQAKAQFELKAAEIVMGTENPGVTLNKAKALQNLFPQYLSANFAESFVPTSFARPDEIDLTTGPVPIGPKRIVSSNGLNRPAAGTTSEFVFNTGKRPPVYKSRPVRPEETRDDYIPAESDVVPVEAEKRDLARPLRYATPRPTPNAAAATPTPPPGS